MSIQVRPLPDGAPEAFDGIVGQYDMTVELMPQVLEPGELATFRITFTGSGNFDQLLPPELPVPGSWRVYGKPPEVIARPFFDEKVFEWTVIPDQSGVHLLSPVIFSYFNPVLLEYQTIESETFSLEVLPRANEAENVAEENAPLIDESLATPAPTPEIILTLKSTEGIVSFGDDRPGASFWFLWLVSPVAVFLSVGWNYRQRQRQRNQIKDRQSQALQRAKSRLQRARSGHSDPYPIVIATVLGYFEDKLASTTGDMTRPQLQAVMIDIGVGDLAQREIMVCLELAEQGRFAPSGAVAFGSLLARTLDTLSAVDTGWKS
jgi:hypothetical protein